MKPDKDITNEQRILDTAEKLFLDRGFALTSTTEIARIVGCNQALVHYYFRTKERLFDAVFEKNASQLVSAFIQGLEENISFEEKIRRKTETIYETKNRGPSRGAYSPDGK